VLRDEPAERDAREGIQELDDRFGDVAADVLEVDVDSLRTRGPQRGEHIVGLVVDARVEAELADDVVALVLRAGDADDATALELRDLTDDGADGARRRGDDDRLAGFRLADVEQADVRGHARHPEHAERRGDRRVRWIELACGDGLRHRMALPAVVALHDVAGLEARMLRLDYFAHGPADHQLARVHALRVRLHA